MLLAPVLRLGARALLAGLAVFVTTLQQANGHITRAVLFAALTAGAWAALEYLTPLNGVVGVGKQGL